MNSKQRRADRKEWRYEVTIDEGKSFADYDAMFDWCVTNFGNGGVSSATVGAKNTAILALVGNSAIPARP